MCRIIQVLPLIAFVIFCSACSEDVEQGHADSGRVDSGQDIVEPGDVSDSSDADVVDDVSDGSDGTDSDTSAACIPGESWCESSTVRGKCSATSGEPYSYVCNSNQVCKDGECVEGEPCEPEAVLGCADEQSLTICNELGNGRLVQTCASETPECIDGSCVARVCTPGELFCQNGDVHQCDERGIGTNLIEQCAHQCSNSTCQFPDYTSCPSSGCEFWAVDLPTVRKNCTQDSNCGLVNGDCVNGYCANDDPNVNQFSVFVANPSSAPLDVTVTTPFDSTFQIQQTVPRGDIRAVSLPKLTQFGSSLNDKSYKIVTSGPASVYQMSPAAWMPEEVEVYQSADASLLLPQSELGTDYLIPSLPAFSMYGVRDSRPFITMIGTVDGTTVQVTSPSPLLAGPGVAGTTAPSTQTYVVDRGQVLQLMAEPSATDDGDLTGAEVNANHPVVVYSGHEGAEIPEGSPAVDRLEEQVFPVQRWGTKYIVANPYHAPNVSSPYRVMASQDGTTVSFTPTIAGTSSVTLDKGEFFEFATEENFVISSTSPVLLSQFMIADSIAPGDNGDPSLLTPTPTSAFRSQYYFFASYGYSTRAVVVTPAGTQLHLDDQPVTSPATPIGQTGWEVRRLEVQPGAHEIRGAEAFGLNVFGYEAYVSYAYPGDLN